MFVEIEQMFRKLLARSKMFKNCLKIELLFVYRLSLTLG